MAKIQLCSSKFSQQPERKGTYLQLLDQSINPGSAAGQLLFNIT